jgi:hypothetical protein
MVCMSGAIGKHWQDAQKGCPARPFQFSLPLFRGVAEAALYCAHRTSTVSSCAFCEQEGHLATPPLLADFFSILLEAKDIEDSYAHKDAIVGKRSERMPLHKREKGCDHNPGDDERHEHSDPECQIVVLPEDFP